MITQLVCFLSCNNFKTYYKMIAINLSQQQSLGIDSKAIQQINVTGSLDWGKYTMYFITEEAKEIILDFSQQSVGVLQFFLT